jgi:hypothetical protein
MLRRRCERETLNERIARIQDKSKHKQQEPTHSHGMAKVARHTFESVCHLWQLRQNVAWPRLSVCPHIDAAAQPVNRAPWCTSTCRDTD